jgi:lactoylglutathione lyase
MSSAPTASLGYVILYVKDVPATMAFYEKAFGLTRRFFHDDNGKAYGELETGAARLAFASLELATEHLKQEVVAAEPEKPPLGFEIALLTPNVRELFTQAINSGATPVTEPAVKPWGQTVAYVRDPNGFLVELCTPMP